MSSKSRAVTVALALAVGLCIPASIAMVPAHSPEPSVDVTDIELVPVAEPIPTQSESASVEPTPVQPSESQSPTTEAVSEPPTPVQPTVTDTPEPTPAHVPTAEPEPVLPRPAGSMPECDHMGSFSCVWIGDERGDGDSDSFVSDAYGNLIYLTHDEARALVDLTDPRDPYEWEEESAPWVWSQLLDDEEYLWERCEHYHDSSCVWVASEHKIRDAAESFISLGDGWMVALSEDQALAMVDG